MAQWLQTIATVGLLLGSASASRSTGELGRSLLQQPVSANCGSQGYIVGQSYCVAIGASRWICPVNQPCACPTTVTGLNPFSCYDPTAYSCSNTSPQWPKSGLISGAGMSNQGACGFPPASAPAPAPGPMMAPAPAPQAEPAPSRMTPGSGTSLESGTTGTTSGSSLESSASG